eukprot:scaffold62536_cov30-Tisochrysis_lutea.AAC.3
MVKKLRCQGSSQPAIRPTKVRLHPQKTISSEAESACWQLTSSEVGERESVEERAEFAEGLEECAMAVARVEEEA